jgi:hypothetical protein
MAGTITGVIEARPNTSNEFRVSGTIFKTLFDFIEGLAGTTRISLYYGDTSGAFGTGTDYEDGAAPFGNKCFAVWRFDTNAGRSWPFYVALACPSFRAGQSGSDWQTEGASAVNSTGYVQVAACIGIGGDENPWNGTTNNDGTDTVGTPRWKVPASGGTSYQPIPSSNRATSGTDAATGNNSLRIFIHGTATTARHHVFADDDTIVFATDEADGGANQRLVYIGAYEPADHITPDRPFIGASWLMNPSAASILGHETGGLANPDSTDLDPATIRFDYGWETAFMSTSRQPDELADSGPAFIPQRVTIDTDDNVGLRGMVGWFSPMIQACYNIPAGDTDTTLSRLVWGEGATATSKFLIPWDLTTTPGTGTTREGISF